MKILRTAALAALVALALTPCLVAAQGGRGGFGGGGRGRGQRGQTDSSAAGAPRTQLSFADMVFARRGDLQLTDSETIRVNDIRMSAMSQRAMLTKEVDSLQAVLATSPGEAETPPTDSSRKATMSQRRELASKIGDLHDVDVNARNATLVVLTPAQQKKAEAFEEAANAPPPKQGMFGNGGGRGNGRPGGMGGP